MPKAHHGAQVHTGYWSSPLDHDACSVFAWILLINSNYKQEFSLDKGNEGEGARASL